MIRTHLALSSLLLAGCFSNAPSSPPAPPANTYASASASPGVVPTVELVSETEWQACQDQGGSLAPDFYCDGQMLEDGGPLRYAKFPAVTRDGRLVAVVEERDGWGHVKPGIRLVDREGRTVKWFSLEGTGDVAKAAVERANAELATHDWVPLTTPELNHKELSDDLSETEIAFGDYTATYQRRNEGNYWLPPSEIRVTDARGRVVVERKDTERAWGVQNACNLPSFELVGASAQPGVILFMTGLGLGGHDCDGVLQPPHWHVLPF